MPCNAMFLINFIFVYLFIVIWSVCHPSLEMTVNVLQEYFNLVLSLRKYSQILPLKQITAAALV